MNKSIYEFERPLIEGKIINRYKRFLADVELKNGEIVTVHVPNSGSMKTCWENGAPVILSDFSQVPTRKLKYTLQAVYMKDGWVGVNTSNPNKAVLNAIVKNLIPELTGYSFAQAEVKISDKSRLDLVLFNDPNDLELCKFFKPNPKRYIELPPLKKSQKSQTLPPCFIEVKNVTLLADGNGSTFPDAVTTRGQKHLMELTQLKSNGARAVILFFVERNSAEWMGPAEEIDPEYARVLRKVLSEGVEAIALKAIVSETGLEFSKIIPTRT